MEKVVITQEQADAIERIKRDQIKRFEEVKQFKSDFIISNWEAPLFELDSKDLQDALYIGYEVELEFKKGDFVVWHGDVVEIKHPQTNDHKDNGRCYFRLERSDGSTYENISRDEIRHATPSEIVEEKERRTEEKLKKLLSELTQEEIKKLRNKLAWEYESSGRIADLAGDNS